MEKEIKKKEINILWILYLLFNIGIIALSSLECYQVVYNSGTAGHTFFYTDSIVTITPVAQGYSMFGFTVWGCLLCTVIFIFKAMWLNIIGTIISLCQTVLVASLVPILSKVRIVFGDPGCRLTPIGIAVIALNVLLFCFSIVLTCIYAKNKRLQKANSAA